MSKQQPSSEGADAWEKAWQQHWKKTGFRVAGWFPGNALSKSVSDDIRPFASHTIIADSTSLSDVVQGLNKASHLFVRVFGEVCGVIYRRDLQKPAMRMWLFGLITVSELRVTRLIDQYCPQDAWTQYLSAERVQKARELSERTTSSRSNSRFG